jgi:3-hydroxybutyrate dehydrogenase
LIVDIGLHRDAVVWTESLPHLETKVVFHKTDVSKWTELESAFDMYSRTFGDIPYIVCAGAGIYEPVSTWSNGCDDCTDQDQSHNGFWKDNESDDHYKVLDVNLLHPIKLSRIAIRRMLAAKSPGVICCVSSIGAQKPSLITPLYGVSKAAVNHFVRCMKDLHGLSGIRVVGVAPGVIKTPLYFDHPEAEKFLDKEKDFMLDPEDVAKAMLALCLDDGSYPSGTVLEVTDTEKWRKVELLNDPGPQGRAVIASKKQEALIDVMAYIEQDRANSGS